MEKITHTTGTHAGTVSCLRTIATMEVGEVWETSVDEVSLGYAQVCCSKYGWSAGRRFKVSSPRTLNGKIIITRIS